MRTSGKEKPPLSSKHLTLENGRDSQELKVNQSLRNAKLPEQDKNGVAEAIADLIWPVTGELEIRTETELKKKALETRITLLVLLVELVDPP